MGEEVLPDIQRDLMIIFPPSRKKFQSTIGPSIVLELFAGLGTIPCAPLASTLRAAKGRSIFNNVSFRDFWMTDFKL